MNSILPIIVGYYAIKTYEPIFQGQELQFLLVSTIYRYPTSTIYHHTTRTYEPIYKGQMRGGRLPLAGLSPIVVYSSAIDRFSNRVRDNLLEAEYLIQDNLFKAEYSLLKLIANIADYKQYISQYLIYISIRSEIIYKLSSKTILQLLAELQKTNPFI